MKYSELQGLSIEELKSKLVAEKEGLRKLKFAHSVTPIENPMKIRESRRLIARISTELNVKSKKA